MKTKMTIVVMSCDDYIDVASINSIFKERYWNDCPYPYILVTQERKPEYAEGFDRIIHCSSSYNWMERLDSVIDNIQSEYILLMVEDMFPYKNVKEINFEKIINFMACNNVGLIKIFPKSINVGLQKIDSGYSEYLKDAPFRVSYCVGLWKKDYLKKYTPCHLNAWQAERSNSEESKKYNERIMQYNQTKKTFLHAIMSGEWQWDAYSIMKTNKVPDNLLQGRRKKKIKYYIKDLVFIIVMRIAPQTVLKIQQKIGIGRGNK